MILDGGTLDGQRYLKESTVRAMFMPLVIGERTRGLGWAMAQSLAQAGARVLLHCRSAERLAPRLATLRAAGFAADAMAFDMAGLNPIGYSNLYPGG